MYNFALYLWVCKSKAVVDFIVSKDPWTNNNRKKTQTNKTGKSVCGTNGTCSVLIISDYSILERWLYLSWHHLLYIIYKEKKNIFNAMSISAIPWNQVKLIHSVDRLFPLCCSLFISKWFWQLRCRHPFLLFREENKWQVWRALYGTQYKRRTRRQGRGIVIPWKQIIQRSCCMTCQIALMWQLFITQWWEIPLYRWWLGDLGSCFLTQVH